MSKYQNVESGPTAELEVSTQVDAPITGFPHCPHCRGRDSACRPEGYCMGGCLSPQHRIREASLLDWLQREVWEEGQTSGEVLAYVLSQGAPLDHAVVVDVLTHCRDRIDDLQAEVDELEDTLQREVDRLGKLEETLDDVVEEQFQRRRDALELERVRWTLHDRPRVPARTTRPTAWEHILAEDGEAQ